MQTPIERAEKFFSDFYLAKHHIPGKIHPFGDGWCVNNYGPIATFDFNELTRLVFLAHDECVRVQIQHSGPGMIKICMWQREGRTGCMFERHPSIDEALAQWRR